MIHCIPFYDKPSRKSVKLLRSTMIQSHFLQTINFVVLELNFIWNQSLIRLIEHIFWLNESNVRSNKHIFTFYYSLISLTRWYCVHVLRFNIYKKSCNIHYNVFFHWFSMDYMIYDGFFSTKIDTIGNVVKFNIIFETWFINNHIPECVLNIEKYTAHYRESKQNKNE